MPVAIYLRLHSPHTAHSKEFTPLLGIAKLYKVEIGALQILHLSTESLFLFIKTNTSFLIY